jgi:hypothetical protein
LSESLTRRKVVEGLCRRILLKIVLREQGVMYVAEEGDSWHAFVRTAMTLQVL